MKRIATMLTAAALGLGTIAVASPAHACVGVQCEVDCLKRRIDNLGRPVACPD